MGDPDIFCPLCCDMKFPSKQALLDHLYKITSNLKCPICSKKFSSLPYIVKHLKVDNCVPVFANPTIIYHDSTLDNHDNTILNTNINPTRDEKVSQNQSTNNQTLPNGINNNVTEAYVDLMSKEIGKSCLQGQELKFIKEESDGQYLLMTGDGALLGGGGAVVTKQNNDGTISLNTVSDINIEPETEFVTIDSEVAESKEEIYTCNTCGVSFTSVTEHIQNYHNDQVVVVEGNEENGISEASIELEPMVSEDPIMDRQISRRMITDTGDIVETPLDQGPEGVTTTRNIVVQINDEATQKTEEIEKYENTVKNKKEVEAPGSYCHKSVVLKEMQTEAGNRIKVYNCTSCHLYVTNLSQFQHHPCKKTYYSCPHCPMTFKNSKSLSAHMKVHKVKTEKFPDQMKFVCEICTTVFPTSKSFKLHKRMHDPIKSRPIEAPVELPYGTIPSEDKFLCLVCDKLIPVDYKIIHQNSHKITNTMICDVCNKKFESKEYLEMHMTVHNMDKVTVAKQDKSLPYNCLYCTRKFARPHEKVKHERIHTGEKPHSCEICGKAFRVSYCLTLHMRTHTGARPYACPHCNKRFKAHSVFNHHLLTHSEVRAYKCPYCPKAFKTSVQLAGHRNSHTKPFACQQCNRPFASLYAVRVHMESHRRHNSLKFACAQCGASYARAFALNDHVRQAHATAPNTDHAYETVTYDADHTADTDNMVNVKIKGAEWNTEESLDANSEDLPVLTKGLSSEIKELTLVSNELTVP